MSKYCAVLGVFLFLFSRQLLSQNITGGRMNEVFSKTTLSASGVLTTPWEITYGPDDSLWITDAKTYLVYKMSPVTGAKKTILDVSNTSSTAPVAFRRTFTAAQNPWPQGGLAGLVIHPDFMKPVSPKKYVYVSYVYSFDSTSVFVNGGSFFTNRIVRFTYNTLNGQLENPVSLCDTLPGSNDHNSQRMIIAPVNGVNYLFYGQGDMGAGQLSSAMRKNYAQSVSNYQGKILRFNLEPDGDAGTLDQWIPNTNPYNGATQSAVWCIGIRNNQGFAYDSVRDILYGSSHGPYSDDEVNIIQPSKNYGHPLVIGYASDNNYNGSSAGAFPASSSSLAVITNETTAAAALTGYKDPLLSGYPTNTANINNIWSTGVGNNLWPSEAWSGLGLYNYSAIPDWKSSLLMAGLKWGRMIRTKLDNTGAATLPNGNMTDTVIYFYGTPRIRDMAFGPNGRDIYFTTDAFNSGAAPTGTKNASLPACLGCVQKFSFLGYNAASGTSTIPTSVTVGSGKANLSEDANTITINAANNALWVPITDTSSNIVAEIFANGSNLGNVTTSVFVKNGAVREQPGTATLYLNRNITIRPAVTNTTAVSVRLYLTTAEFNALSGAVNSLSQPSGVAAITDLSVFKNADANSAAIASKPSVMVTTNRTAFGTSGYVVQVSFAAGTLVSTAPASFYLAKSTSLLPVHLVSFNGALQNNIGQLKWVTENELGTQSFTVERSNDARNFSALAIVPATGTAGLLTYSYADSSIGRQSSQTVYYRLKMTDADGKISYSDIVSLSLGKKTGVINIRPNPVLNDATVEVSAVVAEKTNWTIADFNGKAVLQKSVELIKGSNTITISLSGLPSGTYYLKVNGNNINQSVKLQKL